MANYDQAGGHPNGVSGGQQGYYTAEPPQDYLNADPEDYGYGPGHGFAQPEIEERSFGKTVSMLGAVASLALVVGIGVWGYKLMMRDVSGVPVVRALEGPMREQPKDPGGQPADHQGLAVNAVAANGSAEPTANEVRLAPKPVGLAEEDLPMGEFVEAKTAEKKEAQVAAAEEAEQKPADPVSEEAVAAFQQGQVDALVAELTADLPKTEETGAKVVKAAAAGIVQPEALTPVEIPQDVEPEPASLEPASPVVTGPGVARSLRPQIRPARAVPGDGEAAPAPATAALDVDPASLPVGTKLAQLGAYESAEVARAEWDRIYAKFGDYLEGKQRVIQKASSGGRTFYRLRAMGFDDLSDARRFCSALVAQSADCIPVAIR